MKRKLRVLKAKGGKDASMADFKTPSAKTYSRSYNPGGGGVVQHGGGGGAKGPSNQNLLKTVQKKVKTVGKPKFVESRI